MITLTRTSQDSVQYFEGSDENYYRRVQDITDHVVWTKWSVADMFWEEVTEHTSQTLERVYNGTYTQRI